MLEGWAPAQSRYRVIKSEAENAHALGRFSEADLKQLKSISGKLGLAGFGLDTSLGVYDVFVNHAPAWETAGKVIGGTATSYAVGVGAWALAGTAIGPEGAVITGLVGAVVLSPYGSEWFGDLLGNLDG